MNLVNQQEMQEPDAVNANPSFNELSVHKYYAKMIQKNVMAFNLIYAFYYKRKHSST